MSADLALTDSSLFGLQVNTLQALTFSLHFHLCHELCQNVPFTGSQRRLSMEKKSDGRLFQREKGGIWYIDYRDPVTGKRIRKTTGTRNRRMAEQELERFSDLALSATENATFLQVLKLYSDPATNPRRQECEIEGAHYGMRYAKRVATTAKWFITLFEQSYPAILKVLVKDITRKECKKMREILVKRTGRTRGSQERFRILKTFFSQLYREGSIDNDPCRGLTDIKYEEKERFAIPEGSIARMIAARDMFFNDESWAFFTILATTGMRKGEVLALSKKQIMGKDLMIDAALKSDNKDDIGKPKCEKKRVIRLSNLTLEALSVLKPDRSGRLLHHSKYWAEKQVAAWKVIGKMIDPTTPWEKVTPHILRHSFNTLMVVNGLDRFIIAEYLGWTRQADVIAMQRRYTHIITGTMQEIADKVDEIFGLNNIETYYRLS